MVPWLLGDGIRVTVDVRQVVVQLLLRLDKLRSSVVGNRYKPAMEKSYSWESYGKSEHSWTWTLDLKDWDGLGILNGLEVIKMGFQHIMM